MVSHIRSVFFTHTLFSAYQTVSKTTQELAYLHNYNIMFQVFITLASSNNILRFSLLLTITSKSPAQIIGDKMKHHLVSVMLTQMLKMLTFHIEA